MYVILLNNDNTLVASQRECIMQRSKLVDNLWILVSPNYKENDMSLFKVVLEYVLPCSRKYRAIELVRSEENYQEYLKYVLPFDTGITAEAGDVELQLSFTFVGLNPDGTGVQRVRKTKPTKLHITPIAAWSDIIPDSALSVIDQRLIKVDAQINALESYTEVLSQNQVDNLVYNDKAETLQLMAGENTIGDAVSVRDMLDDGIPVIDLGSSSGSGDNTGCNGCNCNCDCNKKPDESQKPQEPVTPEEPEDDNECDCGCDCEDNVVEFDELTKCDCYDNIVEF